MKKWKRLLAMVLAGVLALCVLAGCSGGGGSSAADSIIDGLNYWSVYYQEGYVFKAGDSALQTKTNELAKTIEDAAKELDFSAAKSTEDVERIIGNDPEAMRKINAAVDFPQAGVDDGSPLYLFGMTDTAVPAGYPGGKNRYYAYVFGKESDKLNAPERDYSKPAEWTYGEIWETSVATLTIAGKQYMIALFKTTAVSVAK